MATRLDLIDQRFGKLVVTARAGSDKHQKATWRCLCDCGVETVVSSGNLRKGNSRSCGCVRDEKIGALHLSHGHFRNYKMSPTYAIWHGMLTRCTNPNTKQWKDYGGRGITVCERWRLFENFLADMGERPPNLQIDRINNNENYEPSNCQWVTHAENCAPGKRRSP